MGHVPLPRVRASDVRPKRHQARTLTSGGCPLTPPSPQLRLQGRYVPDVVEAQDEWGANCGPTAIAAALELTMAEIRAAVSPNGTFQGYMGVRDLGQAITKAGGRIVRAWSKPSKSELRRTDGSAIVVLIRFLGPWDDIPRAAAKHRHAFCYRHGYVGTLDDYGQREHGPGWIYDCNNLVNLPETGRLIASWAPLHLWRADILPRLIPKRGSGETEIDWMGQVEKS